MSQKRHSPAAVPFKLTSRALANGESSAQQQQGQLGERDSKGQTLTAQVPFTPQRASKLSAKQLHLRGKAACLTSKTEVTAQAKLKSPTPGPLTATLSLSELEETAPVSVIEDVLPANLASALLQELSHSGPDWVRGSWWMFGKQHAAPRTSAYFTLPHAEAFDEKTADGAALDVSAEVSRLPASPALVQAAAVIDHLVSERLTTQAAALQPDDRAAWASTYALANFYRDGQECVGAHADKMTLLGPRPIIASLSLGAGRVFRLRPSATAPLHQGREVSFLDIQLQHNMLVIMWPPCQEAWHHEVPRSKGIQRHAISGEGRINLTFRRLKPAWAARAPQCRCNQRSVMRCSSSRPKPKKGSVQSSSGPSTASWLGRPGAGAPDRGNFQPRYYYACDNTQGPGCGFWQELPMQHEPG
ncbi:hypothetical protein WJX74_000986 [Apatococcus lobatus]|uniref:Fe2OG dioxygenase domain-containing protein n=1 Tax=Apatococcus lobatus TaxID=904363 RepID=A0AAW1RRR3_9CHLO